MCHKGGLSLEGAGEKEQAPASPRVTPPVPEQYSNHSGFRMMLSQFLCEGGLGPGGWGQRPGCLPEQQCDTAAPPGGQQTSLLTVAGVRGAPASPRPHRRAPPAPPRVPQPLGTAGTCSGGRRTGQAPREAESAAAVNRALARAGERQLSLAGPFIPPPQAARGSGCGPEGKAGGAGDSCHPSSRPFPVAGLQGMK